MNKARKDKVYQVGRLKILVNLIKKEEDSNQTRVLEVIPRTSPKSTTRKLILNTRYLRILHHQKAGIYLTVLLEILNKENLSNPGSAKDHTMLSTAQTERKIPPTYTLFKKQKQLGMWPMIYIGSMQHWKTDMLITRILWWKCKV